MKKELPSKFRFKANGYNYLAELSSQANVYHIYKTDSDGKGCYNLNQTVMKEESEVFFRTGHWKIIEEDVLLPKKFTFTIDGVVYTAKESKGGYIVSWDSSTYVVAGSYYYDKEDVARLVKEGSWKITELIDVAVEEKSEPTLLDVIKEFVETTKSEVTILPQGKWNVSCSFLSKDVLVDNEDDLKNLLAATSSIVKMAVGKMVNGNKK